MPKGSHQQSQNLRSVISRYLNPRSNRLRLPKKSSTRTGTGSDRVSSKAAVAAKCVLLVLFCLSNSFVVLLC